MKKETEAGPGVGGSQERHVTGVSSLCVRLNMSAVHDMAGTLGLKVTATGERIDVCLIMTCSETLSVLCSE